MCLPRPCPAGAMDCEAEIRVIDRCRPSRSEIPARRRRSLTASAQRSELDAMRGNPASEWRGMPRSAGLAYYGFRYADPVTGRWMSRDPRGENWGTGEFNEYAFVANIPIRHSDVLGLFKAGGVVTVWEDGLGRPGHRSRRKISETYYKGHKDFANIKECPFNYNWEDNNPATSPLNFRNGTKYHFQTREESMGQARNATDTCDAARFASAMHRLQDYQTHRRKNFEWSPKKGKLVHPFLGNTPETNPDLDNDAWEDANQDTVELLGNWLKKCCRPACCPCKRVKRSEGQYGGCKNTIVENGKDAWDAWFDGKKRNQRYWAGAPISK